MNFSEFYANSYDKIHASKVYAEEANQIIEFVHKQFPNSKNLKILDFGCGTGVHLAELANESFELAGYDPNEHMLKVAKKNFPQLHLTSDHSALQDNMDLVYSIFDVTSYQVAAEDLEEFFFLIASKLRIGGVVALDGWHYLGVKLDPPQTRERSFEMDGMNIVRRVEPSTLDDYRTTSLKISLINQDTGQVIASEVHEMRAFLNEEIFEIATKVGFSNIHFMDGKNWTQEINENSWKFMMSAEYAPN
jgi:SAM-dependent methyltransferase